MIQTMFTALAMAGPGGSGAQGGNPLMSIAPMLLIFAIFYFMLIRPQQRKEKERRAMIDNIKSGEKIMFSGGIIGTVTNVKDNIFVVKIADNVKIEVARSAANRVIEKGEKVGSDDA